MYTQAVTGTSGGSTGSTAQTSQNILGKDDFLKLLITELKNQDPLDPVENKDFISQMASFSSLEQMQNLSSSFDKMAGLLSLQQAASLIGRQVEYTATGQDGASVIKNGLVNSVSRENSVVYLVIDGSKVSLDQVTAVS